MAVRKDRLWIIVLSFIVLLPNLFLAFSGSEYDKNFPKQIMLILLSCSLFLLPSLFLKAKTFFLFMGIFVILAPFEIGYIYFSKVEITYGFISSVINTGVVEALELLSTMKMFLVVIVIFWALYFFIALKKIKNEFLFPGMKYTVGLLSCCVVLWTGVFGYSYYASAKRSSFGEIKVMDGALYGFRMKFHKIYPYDMILVLTSVLNDRKEIFRQEKKLNSFSFHAKKEKDIRQKELYVLVIGESARYANFSVNGYKKPTSPLLERITNLISFSDFYAEANLTSSCIPLILTRATPHHMELSRKEKTFVDAFKEAGFRTYWIGNQGVSDLFIRRVTKNTDHSYFNLEELKSSDNYDTNLWPYLDAFLKNDDEKVLIVIHTLGSHFRYNLRYPKEFNVFRPSFERSIEYYELQPNNREKLLNTYDNSILFTDYFLGKTIQKLDSLHKVSCLVYLSDHGENLGETKDNLWLHSGTRYSEFDLHVPLFVWYSDKYQAFYPEKVKAFVENKDKKLSTVNVFYSVLDMAGITFPGQNLQKSFASDEMKEDSIRHFYNVKGEVEEVGK